MAKYAKRILLILLLALVVSAAIAAVEIGAKKAEPSAVAAADFGGPFTLTRQDGGRVTEKDYADSLMLIYFGFTYCPAICPTELQKMSSALKLLGNDAGRITPVFISVDPERDTVPVMRDYVALFHPRLEGLTGSREDIDAVLKTFKVYAVKVDDPEATEYTMDHSSFLYLYDPDDRRLLSLYRTGDTAQNIADDIRKWLD